MRAWLRGRVICDMERGPDGWCWLGFIAVADDHRFFGDHFVYRLSGPSLSHVVHTVGNELYDKRWWLCFEGSRLSESHTLAELLDAADELSAVPSDEENPFGDWGI